MVHLPLVTPWRLTEAGRGCGLQTRFLRVLTAGLGGATVVSPGRTLASLGTGSPRTDAERRPDLADSATSMWHFQSRLRQALPRGLGSKLILVANAREAIPGPHSSSRVVEDF